MSVIHRHFKLSHSTPTRPRRRFNHHIVIYECCYNRTIVILSFIFASSPSSEISIVVRWHMQNTRHGWLFLLGRVSPHSTVAAAAPSSHLSFHFTLRSILMNSSSQRRQSLRNQYAHRNPAATTARSTQTQRLAH